MVTRIWEEMMDSIYGIVPPVVTPFREDDSIDEGAFRAEIQYMIETAKVHGLAVTGSTGEGHTLKDDEVRQLTQWAVEEADGRVPVITGIITDSTKSAIERGKAVADLGPVALQVTPVHYLFRPDDDAMVRHFEALCEGTGLPVMIYNVVPWTYLSPELLARIIDEVEGVVGVKQSAGDMKLLADLLLMAGDRARIMTAVDALLYPSFVLGAHGAIAAILTAVPELCVAVWVEALCEGAGLPVMIYNVVPWTYLSPELLARIIDEVEGVVGVKQSAGDMKLLADLLLMAGDRARIMTAVDALLYPSFVLGAHGAIAAILTAVPELCVAVWDACRGGDHKKALDLHEKLLPIWNAIFDDNLPANTKYAMKLQGRDGGVPRPPMPPPSAEQEGQIQAALENAGVI